MIPYSSSSTATYFSLPLPSQQQAAAEGGKLIACSSWEYNANDNLGNTWTSQWDLVCDKEYMKNVAEMFFLLGVATGGIISGYLSDKFGRKTMLFISAVLQTIFGKWGSSYACHCIINLILILIIIATFTVTAHTHTHTERDRQSCGSGIGNCHQCPL